VKYFQGSARFAVVETGLAILNDFAALPSRVDAADDVEDFNCFQVEELTSGEACQAD
jgi:hypothetical protein